MWSRKPALRSSLIALGVALTISAAGVAFVYSALPGSHESSDVSIRRTTWDTALGLNRSTTEDEMPALAALLDEATLNGRAYTRGAEADDILWYLNWEAYEAGFRDFDSAPLRSHAAWGNATFAIQRPVH